jgi:hypothetical protein
MHAALEGIRILRPFHQLVADERADVFEQVAIERQFTFDWVGYKKAMEDFGTRSGGAQVELFGSGPIESLKNSLRSTEFVGYDEESTEVTIKGIVATVPQNGESAEQLVEEWSQAGADHQIIVVTDITPFYGESGGQVGDQGTLSGKGFEVVITDTQKDSESEESRKTPSLKEERFASYTPTLIRTDDQTPENGSQPTNFKRLTPLEIDRMIGEIRARRQAEAAQMPLVPTKTEQANPLRTTKRPGSRKKG